MLSQPPDAVSRAEPVAQRAEEVIDADCAAAVKARFRVPPVRLRLFLLTVLAAASIGLFVLFKLLALKKFPAAVDVLSIWTLCALGVVVILEQSPFAARAASSALAPAAAQRRAAWFFIGVGVAGSLAFVWVLRAFPNSGDEYDYLWQASTFLGGRLWNPVPPLHEFFAHYWQVFWNGKWITIYPPGWPALLAAAMALRLPPWVASPIAGGVLLFALFKLGERREGALGGLLAVALVAVSPFFLFNAASYFMHVPAAAAGVLFCWAAVDFLDRPRPSRALLGGIALGALGLIRPEDVPLFALPFAAEFLWRAGRRHYRSAPFVILGGLPFLVALMLYYHATFGSFVPDLAKFYPTLKFGLFPVNDYGMQQTPLDELHFAAKRLLMLGLWTSPLLAIGSVAAFIRAAALKRLSFLDFVFPLFVLGYLLVPFRAGNEYGPRYYFEGYPLLVLTLVSGLAPLLRDAVHRRRAGVAALLVMAHGGLCLKSAVDYGIFFRRVVDQRLDLYNQVRAQGLDNAVVLLRSGTSPLDPMKPMDLTRNGLALNGRVIYALYLPGRLKELERFFPNRRFYVYERGADAPKGTLRPLSRADGGR